MQRALCFYGDPILHLKGKEVEVFDAQLKSLVEDLFETMYAEEGIGLAAQQIGIAEQICVIDVRPPKESEIQFNYLFDNKPIPLDLFMPLALINPRVTIIDSTESLYQEGCLSFPNILGSVARPKEIICHFLDPQGNPHVIKSDGLLARCILHEVDHLNGLLFIDKMESKDLRKNQIRIKQLKRAFKK